MVTMMRVLIFGFGHAAVAVARWHEAAEAVADDAFALLARDVGDVGNGGAVLALGRVSGEGNHAATTYNRKTSHCQPRTRKEAEMKRNWQLSRSRAVLTHSHALGLLPYTPHANQPFPLSAQEPLPSQRRLLLRACWEGHAPLGTHWPLQICMVWSHLHSVGLFCGKGVNPSMHLNAHFVEPQMGLEWSG
jgi:hypothetical protein